MPCACAKCLYHAQTLGLPESPSSKDGIRKAFHVAAKIWHPDRHENNPVKRLEAEEKFKGIHAAYSALLEHYENPVELPLEIPFAPPPRAGIALPVFDNAPGCFVAPDFSPRSLDIISVHVHEPNRAVAIVDLSGHAVPPGTLAQYILFTLHCIFVRDAFNILSLLWYDDLGDVKFTDLRKSGKLPFWQSIVEKLSGTEQKYSLEIHRRNGTLFYAIASQADDSVKKVIYNFLQQMRPVQHL